MENAIWDMLTDTPKVTSPIIASTATSTDPDSVWSSYDEEESSADLQSTHTSVATKKIRQYCDEMPIRRHEQPLEWWRSPEVLYPQIAQLIRKHLSLVATSVPYFRTERVFSKAGEVLSLKRNRLGNDNSKRILFLNGNMSHYYVSLLSHYYVSLLCDR